MQGSVRYWSNTSLSSIGVPFFLPLSLSFGSNFSAWDTVKVSTDYDRSAGRKSTSPFNRVRFGVGGLRATTRHLEGRRRNNEKKGKIRHYSRAAPLGPTGMPFLFVKHVDRQ